MSRTLEVRSRCVRCHCAVELGFEPWAGSGPATAAEWTCPGCDAVNQVPAIGEVTWVDARSGAKPERTPPVRTH